MTKKKVISTLMAATIVAGSSMTAFAASATTAPAWGENGGQSEVTGDSWTVQPVIEVELPAELTFGVNPMMLDADGDATTTGDNTQILSTDYLIVNYSNVPVEIKTETKVTVNSIDGVTADPIKFVPAPVAANWDAATKELKNAAGQRDVLLIQQLPTAAATIGTDGAITMVYTKPTWGTDTPAAANISGHMLDTTANEIYFLLTANDGELDPANVSGFTFSGAVNPNTQFYDGEITVSTVFTCNIITAAQAADTTKYTPGSVKAGTTGAGKATGYDTTVAEKKATP